MNTQKRGLLQLFSEGRKAMKILFINGGVVHKLWSYHSVHEVLSRYIWVLGRFYLKRLFIVMALDIVHMP